MYESTGLGFYTICADYEKYCNECHKEGREAAGFFKYAFGQY